MRTKKELVPQRLSQINNLEAEQCILGCLLIDDGDCEATEEIMQALTIQDFYFDENKKFFQVMKALFDRGIKIDIVSVADLFERQGEKSDYMSKLIAF
mgnify:FL=1